MSAYESDEAQAYIQLSVLPRIRSYLRHDSATGCDVWVGALTKGGYPQLSVRRDILGKPIIHVHRFLLEEELGVLPVGIDAEHACRNRACIRIHPDHVRPLSHMENVRIGIAYSPDVAARRSEKLRGRHRKPLSVETKAKLSLARLGKKMTKAQKQALRDGWARKRAKANVQNG